MLLIHADKLTNKLEYIFRFFFENVVLVNYQVTSNTEEFIAYTGAKLSYGKKRIDNEFFIESSDFLSSSKIQTQDIKPTNEGSDFYIFPIQNPDSELHFDIFSAAFYLLSRYEEYLPHTEDYHNRFNVKDSLAYKYKFLQKPLINMWVLDLAKRLNEKYSNFAFKKNKFKFIPTFDIDSAYAYKHRPLAYTIPKFAKSILKIDFKALKEQLNVLLGKKKDPYDTYDFIISSIKKYKLNAVIFILLGEYGKYDKCLSAKNKYYQQLILKLQQHSTIGIHPSYISFNNSQTLSNEIISLYSIMQQQVIHNRFHYIRFSLPDSYKYLLKNGVKNDYSMGYTSEYGFRASTCTPFYFYDLLKDCETDLLVHPFAIMDGTVNYYQQHNADEIISIYKSLITEVQQVGGNFYAIWHNETFSNQHPWEGWREIYTTILESIK